MATEASVSAGPAGLNAPRGDAFYRALVEGMNDGVLTRDADGVITYASPRFRDMLGYRAEELVGSRSDFVLPPEQRGRWERSLAAAAQGPQRFEHDLICKDGSRVSVAVSRRPVFDGKGVFQGSVALVSNITEERRASRLLQEVAQATAPHVGEEFFRAAVRFLAQALGCKIVFVTECVNFPTTRVRTLARWASDRLVDNVEYDLAGTPCEETIGAAKVFHCASGVESRFSAERGLGVEGYLGVPLFALDGAQVIGHLAFVNDAPIDGRLLEHPVVSIFASRAEAELRRKRADDTMFLIGRAVAPLSGDVFFRTLLEQLVRTFGFRQAFISECLDSPPTRVRTVAYWDDTGLRENTEFDLAGLPCEITLREARPYFIPDRLEALYPAEAGRRRVSYLGLPIFRADRRQVVGHLAFFDDRPRPVDVLDSPAFRILASRAGVELLRKRAEDDLRESEAKYRLLVENQTDLLVKLDREGRYVFVSPSFCRCFGKSEAELLGRRFELEANPLDRGAFEHALGAVLAPPYRSHCEARVLAAKEWRWLAWECSAILDERGAVAEVIASGRDVTERKRAEEQARQHLQQLAHVTRLASMGEMASAIAHEINQPLAAITTYTQACVRLLRSSGASLEEITETMERVGARAERASEIIRHLRSFVRKEDAQPIPVQVNFLVSEIVRLVQSEAAQSGVEIVTDLGADLPPVLADNIQIEQVLLNLVRNAIDAICAAGMERREVRIVTRRGADGMVAVGVHDSGPGFDDETARRLFEPFFTTKELGMGIGLSISRSIVEAHQGRIWASSARGGGASFHLVLPAAAG
ncbi:MAG TPA: PAS domain S-box protein [Burkholderiales bacterium]|nr:PAS domain S-box protein [Burkholderiales bacterium]